MELAVQASRLRLRQWHAVSSLELSLVSCNLVELQPGWFEGRYMTQTLTRYGRVVDVNREDAIQRECTGSS